MDLEKIFLGITPANQRKFVTEALRHLLPKYPKLYMPTCGSFVLTKCAVDAGYKPENIYCSDISLFSSLLGYFYMGKPVEDLKFSVGEGYETRYAEAETQVEKVAVLMWIMKIKQLRPQVHYERMYLDEYKGDPELYIRKIIAILEKQKAYFDGMNYEILDLRDEITRPHPDAIVIMDAPIYARGYDKMFDFGEAIEFESGITEFDLKKEYLNLYQQSREQDAPFLWSKYFTSEGVPEGDIIYADQKKPDRTDYWLCTKPEIVSDFAQAYRIDMGKTVDLKRARWPIFTDNDELTENSIVTFHPVDMITALYYRDMFAHKLGLSKAEHYYLMLVDGRVFATIGVLTNGLFKMQTDRFLQQFAMNAPLTKHPKANRLVIMCLTTTEFGRFLRATASKFNRTYQVKGMQTTFFSKFNKAKLNNGLMQVIRRDKLKDGRYKIIYDAALRKETYKDCLVRYLKEVAGE